MPAQGEDASGSSAPTPTVILAQPRDPGTFSGTDNTDVEDWLQLYERVSTSNHWNQTAMLANLIFYLAGTARVWFQTHEEELTTWDICKQKLTDLFGKPVGRQRAAQKTSLRVPRRALSPTSHTSRTCSLCAAKWIRECPKLIRSHMSLRA